MNKNLRILLTGSTGMVGEGVLLECLNHPDIGEVVVLNRHPTYIKHPKLTEVIVASFFEVEQYKKHLSGFDACYFCLGISSVGLSEESYERITYDLTLGFAKAFANQNPNAYFFYVSGSGTDEKEISKIHWARVKGKVENELEALHFKRMYRMRPGFILPLKRQKYAKSYYDYIGWLFPIGRFLSPKNFCKMEELAAAFIYLTKAKTENSFVEGTDIIRYAKEENKAVN